MRDVEGLWVRDPVTPASHHARANVSSTRVVFSEILAGVKRKMGVGIRPFRAEGNASRKLANYTLVTLDL
jgi:hypothetical protein